MWRASSQALQFFVEVVQNPNQTMLNLKGQRNRVYAFLSDGHLTIPLAAVGLLFVFFLYQPVLDSFN